MNRNIRTNNIIISDNSREATPGRNVSIIESETTASEQQQHEQEFLQTSSRSTTHRRTIFSKLTMIPFLKEFKSCILSSEDDYRLKCVQRKIVDKEPLFVIIDSSGISNPSSKELFVEKTPNAADTLFAKYLTKNVMPSNFPSTSRDINSEAIHFPVIRESVSKDEMQMVDINLQSDNEIRVPEDENEGDNQSVVLSYLRDRFFYDLDGIIDTTKKKSSLLDNVLKMETIIEEGKRLNANAPNTSSEYQSPCYKCEDEDKEEISKARTISTRAPQGFEHTHHADLSEDSLDVFIPSFPASPRSFSMQSITSQRSKFAPPDPLLLDAIQVLHEEKDLLVAAETGNDAVLEMLLRSGTDLTVTDHIGRNALHLCVTSGSERAITLLLQAGVDPKARDNLGRTPLSLCLMRRPSLKIANLLFSYGAELLQHTGTADTGLFLQFVMFCKPTDEDEKIIRLLVEKGGLVDDPTAPGRRQALHIAAMSNNCELIRILIDLGANPFAKSHRNETPREVAQHFKCKEAAELLAEIEKHTSFRPPEPAPKHSFYTIMKTKTLIKERARAKREGVESLNRIRSKVVEKEEERLSTVSPVVPSLQNALTAAPESSSSSTQTIGEKSLSETKVIK